MSKRISSLLVLFVLLVSIFTVMSISNVRAQTGQATLTGTIFDHGVATNGSLYDYLEIDVEINVTVAGSFQVSVSGLYDQFYNYTPVSNVSQGYLGVGIGFLNVTLLGPMIFASGIDPQTVNYIELTTGNVFLDYRSLVPLSRVYNYNEFAPPGAFLTGHISDRGVDTDNDGLFNYLEVGIEINVTIPGEYQVSVDGLITIENSTITNYLFDYQYEQESFAVGVQMVYLNFSGPEIASEHFNPNGVYYISVYDPLNSYTTSTLDSAPLSMQYNYTLFNGPARDIQLNFKVYPNATVAVDGALNFTNMYPENTYLENATVGFSTSGNLTTVTSGGTMVLPASSINYSASEEHLSSSYSNGVESATINSSTVLLPQVAGTYPFNTSDVNFNATYAGGLFDVAIGGSTVMPAAYSSVFPFNASDVTVLANFDGTTVTGNVTFHTIGGFPLGDVTFDFSGNRSSLYFTGNVNVTYGNYLGNVINETTLDQMLNTIGNMTGQGTSSLYNMTGGYLQCTELNYTKIPWSDLLGADVTFTATVNGSFTGAIAYQEFPTMSNIGYLQDLAHASLESAASSVTGASLTLNYYHSSGIAQINMHLTSDVKALCSNLLLLVPPAIPSTWSSQSTQIQAWLQIANATAYALTGASLNASYSSAEGKMSLNAWLSANISQLKNDVFPILPDAVPSSVHDLMASFVNISYCTLTSSTETFDMVNGIATFTSSETLQGDLEAEVNRDKSLLLEAFSTLYSTPLPWDLRMLNETDIDISNFQAQFKVGQDWMQASFSGLVLKPQADTIDPIRFELKSWLNVTNDPTAPPNEFDKVSVTVSGASSANQTVILYKPSDVPAPNSLSEDYTSMAWDNVSLSSLQDLMLLEAYEEHVSYGAGYRVLIFTNSTVPSFTFDPSAKQIDFSVSGPLGTEGFCNVTIPRSLLNATNLGDWVVKLDGTALNSTEFSITQNEGYVFVYLNYTHSEHTISIIGTIVAVPEVQPDILPLILAISTLIAAIITIKQRRKLQPLKAKCRQALSTLSLKPRS